MLTKDDLDLIRGVIREEVEAEAKTTRQENTLRYVKLLTEVNKVADRVKDVEITGTRLEKGLQVLQGDVKSLQEGQKTTDLKVEAFHSEQKRANTEIVSTLHEIGEVNAKDTDKRFERIEKHLNFPPIK
jgi:chromosome segregation ATPase